jgi:O-antigen/teichoic acid export membrane protein
MAIDNTKENKRLAKNTLFLYFRMFLTLLVGLYTSRVVLNVLGVVDYGINNVVGGVVAIFGSLNGAMASTSSRYITFYLGKGDKNRLREIFSTVAYVHIGIAFLVVLLCETIGLWFFYNKMQIPVARLDVAFWLLQFSFAGAFLSMINTPFTGLIIAHEKMDIYAYISIFDVIAKLAIVFLIQVTPFDKLLTYGFLFLVVNIIDFFIYRTYCVKSFDDSHLKFIFDKPLFKELAGYFCWSIAGNVALAFNGQGINMVLNMFFGPAVNAARGVAYQVQNIINQFVGNFQVALNPQIVKTYANKEMERMYNLMYASSKYGFLLLFFLSLPVMVCAHYILKLWLGIVPEHTVNFLRIILVVCMVNAMANSSIVAAGATGHIRKYTIINSFFVLAPLPLSYIGLKAFHFPELVFFILLLAEIVTLASRLILMHSMIGLSIKEYSIHVFLPNFLVVIVSAWIPICLHLFLDEDFTNTVLICLISFLVVAIAIYFVGLNQKEKELVSNIVRTKILRR